MILKFRLLVILNLLFLAAACSPAARDQVQPQMRALKVLVDQSGVYQLNFQELESAGLDVSAIDPNRIKVLYRGEERPRWVAGSGDDLNLRFYAQPVDNQYARHDIYWLVDERNVEDFQTRVGESIRFDPPVTSSPNIATAPDTHIATHQLEENLIYAPQAPGQDRWFWLSMPGAQSQQFTLELEQVGPGAGRISVYVLGTTEAPESPDHHLRIMVNGQQLADQYWDGKGSKLLQAPVPEGLLQDGYNTLLIDSPGDTGVAADIVLLDKIYLEYSHYLIAVDDRLELLGSEEFQILSGFSGPVDVYDVSEPASVKFVETLSKGAAPLEFVGQEDRRYLLLGPNGYLAPDGLSAPLLAPGLKDVDLEADYVAIGPDDLLEPLQPLMEHRRNQGYKVFAVPIDSIYDQFNFGFPEPEAIRAFLRYAAENWKIYPRHVLLVGDSTYDPLGYLGTSPANRLPVFLVDTVFGGQTASDLMFARLDQDSWLDVAIGRIPAQTPDQVVIWVEKQLEYELGSRVDDWNQRILAVADGQERTFQRDAQRFLDQLPDNFQKTLVNPEAGSVDANIEIKNHIQSGNLMVAYFGHGSINMWGKDRLFSSTDVGDLSNQRNYPLVLNMTCLTGLFTHPKVDSLAESLLWHENGGAVAVLAPTSLTLPTDQSFLSDAFADALIANPDKSLGEILSIARKNVPVGDRGTQDVLETFLYFGDPAMKLR